jgi:hypothetical protein
MKKILLLLLLYPASALAQYSVWSEPVINQLGQPIAGATVAVCSGSSIPNLTVPCGGSSLATIYSSFTGGTQFNPLFTDAYGRAPVYAASGNYYLQIYGTGLQTTVVPISIGGGTSGGGGGSGTVNPGLQNSLAYYVNTGTANTVGPLAAPTLPGSYIVVEKPSAGVVTSPFALLPGVVPNPQTCSGNAYVYEQTDSIVDRAAYTTFNDSSSCAVTLPQAGSTGFGSNWVNVTCDIGSGPVVITPQTSTISYTTGSAYTSAATSVTLSQGQCIWIYSDNSNYFGILLGGSTGGGVSGSWTSNNNLVTTAGTNTAQDSGMCIAHGSAIPGSSDQIAAAGNFATTISMPNTCLAVGTLVIVRAHGVYTTTSTASPKMGFSISAGGTSALCTQTSYTISVSITNGTWDAACYIKINTTGAPGSAVVWGPTSYSVSSGVPANTNVGAFYASGTGTGTVAFTTNATETVSIGEVGTLVSGQTFNLAAIDVTVQK